jgi:hypothetical protein
MAKTPEAIQKRKDTFKEINHQAGEKNSMYGLKWITNECEKKSIRVKIEEVEKFLSLGWTIGRKMFKQ